MLSGPSIVSIAKFHAFASCPPPFFSFAPVKHLSGHYCVSSSVFYTCTGLLIYTICVKTLVSFQYSVMGKTDQRFDTQYMKSKSPAHTI